METSKAVETFITNFPELLLSFEYSFVKDYEIKGVQEGIIPTPYGQKKEELREEHKCTFHFMELQERLPVRFTQW
jgi:hypothetical protein